MNKGIKQISLSSGKSSWLDFIRCTSALLVLIGHVEMVFYQTVGTVFTKKSPLCYIFFQSHQAVVVFFVLSGYLITYTVLKKAQYSFREYFLDRWSRIYSVLIPVVFLTIAVDFAGSRFSAAYNNSAIFPQDSFIIRFLANLFSLQGILGHRIQLGSNPALWSIGYEFWFYIIFGVFIFTRKKNAASFIKYGVILAIFLIFGIEFFGYFCLWLLGALACYLFHVKKFQRGGLWFGSSLAGLFIINHFFIYDNVFKLKEYAGDFLLAIALALVFVSKMDYFLDSFKRISKFLSKFSYTLYAVHLPVMYFIALIMLPREAVLKHPYVIAFSLAAIVLGFAYLFYLISESRRSFFREKLANFFLILHGLKN